MTRRHFMIVWGLIGVQLVVSLALMKRVPAIAPTHWDMHGQVDGYGPRWLALYLMPAICALLSALLVVMPQFGQMRENIERSSIAYGRISIAAIAFVTVVHSAALLIAVGVRAPMNRVIVIGMGLLFAVIGNVMGKVRRNLWMGIRTPWTLKNDVVWERTHRVAAKVFFAVGLAMALAAVFLSNWVAVIGALVVIVLISVWACAYSYYVFRQVTRAGQVS